MHLSLGIRQETPSTRHMRYIPGGTFLMGCDHFYPEERPVHRVHVDGFWMDEHPVTVAEFRRFVQATGYVTLAERPLDPADYPDADPELLVPGSLVFQPHGRPGRPRRLPQLVGATCPARTGATRKARAARCSGRERHPVVHVAYEDAEAYAAWAGKDAADRGRVGVRGARRPRRRGLRLGRRVRARGQDDGEHLAGRVPLAEPAARRLRGHLTGRAFPPNGYGLYDMAGNVWEWTSDFFTPRHPTRRDGRAACRATRASTHPAAALTGQPGEHIPRRVIKGGSHLCAPNYCLRYRPAARQGETVDTSTGHIGFRCIVRQGSTR